MVVDLRPMSFAKGVKMKSSHYIKWTLILIALVWIGIILIAPIVILLIETFRSGIALAWAAIIEKDSLIALKLTLFVTAITIPVNCIIRNQISIRNIRR